MNRLGLLFGFGFGFLIAAARLNEYDVIHGMLLLRDLEPYLFMGSATAVAVPLLWLLQRRGWRTRFGGRLALGRAPIERRHVLGAMVFGTGWAIAGTCPVPAATMLGNGTLMGGVVVAGILGGIVLRDAVAARALARGTTPRHDVPDTAMAPAGA